MDGPRLSTPRKVKRKTAGADTNVQDKNGRTALMNIISSALGQDLPGKYTEQVELCD